jgi:cytochrome c oxidase accessory protein FixG
MGASETGPASEALPPRVSPSADSSITVSLYEKWRKIYPLWVSGGWQASRRVVLVILLLVFYLAPWLRWNGEPGVWLDLEHRRFTILWATFVPEEFILLAWALLIAALALFTVTVAAGRVFCGWACPQTIWTLVYFSIERWVEGDRAARMRMDRGRWNLRRIRKKAIKYALWAGLSFSISLTLVGLFEPIRELIPRILTFDLSRLEIIALVLPAAGSFLISGVLREQVCFHMCPYARFQSVMFDHDSLIISYDKDRGDPRGSRKRSADPATMGLGSCVDCMKCVNVCPTGIDIRDGLQYQCIGCAACIDACTDVMATMGYGESLVRYSSENKDIGQQRHWLRPRLVGYASLILVMVGMFAYALSHRVPVGFDVARDRNRLYRQNWDGSVENVFTLRVANRESSARDYAISFESALPLEYHGPKTMHVAGGEFSTLPIRLVLPGDVSEMAEPAEVVFRIEPLGSSGFQVEEESRFHLPSKASK